MRRACYGLYANIKQREHGILIGQDVAGERSLTRMRAAGRRWTLVLVFGGCALIVAVFAEVRVVGDLNTVIHRPPAIENSLEQNAEAPVILMGSGSRHGEPFYLAGGTYRVVWSAWGPAAEFPPCTHSAELLAVDPANATTPGGHVADLAKLAHVPATGGSEERYVANLKPGEYYVDVSSECGWQIALSPSN